MFSMSSGFSAIVDGKNEEMSTSELSGGARIHHIFQNIFVRSLDVSFQHSLLHCFGSDSLLCHEIEVPLLFLIFLENHAQDVDPCDDLTDEDIRTAIQNATGPKNIIFVPEVCYELMKICKRAISL